MSLRLIYGRIGSGKTRLCIKEALESGKHVYFITPEQFTFTAEKRICELANVHGLGGVEVLSLKRLAHRTLTNADGAALPQLDARTKIILLQKILLSNVNKLTVLQKAAKQQGTASTLAKLFGEMKRYNICSQDLLSAADSLPKIGDKLRDVALLFSVYEEEIQDKFCDRDDNMGRFATVLRNSEILADTEIYLDRFDGFDDSEFDVITEMLKTAERVTITLCFHPEDKGLNAFKLHAKMAERLLKIAEEAGCDIEKPIVLERERNAAPALCFLEKNFFRYPTKEYEDIPEGLQLVTAANPLGEIHTVARRILEFCRENGYLYRDIAIAARNTEQYKRYIEAVLPAYNIPFFMDRTVRILEHPFTVFVLSALDIILNGYSYDTVFRYVKSGFVRLPSEEIDMLENYVLASGIRGDIWKEENKWEHKMAVYADKDAEEDIQWRQTADRVRRKIIAPLLNFENALREGKTAREKCEALYTFIEEMKAERRILALAKLLEKNGDLASAAEYKGVYNDFIDALDGVCDAFGDEKISTKKLSEVLKIALGEVKTGIIPAAQDGVFVGDIDRIKGYDVKALFVVGTLDGVFPATPDHSGILSDMDRIALSETGLPFSYAANKTFYEEEHLIYKCLTIPSSHIEISFPGANMDGMAQMPSRIYTRIKELFPKVKEKNMLLGLSEEDKISVPEITMQYILNSYQKGEMSEKLCMAWGWIVENIPGMAETAFKMAEYKNQTKSLQKETVRAFLGDTVVSSVSRLERLASCPFSYYATYILGAKERRVMQTGKTDAGRFLHDFIDLFSKKLREDCMKWQDVTEAYIDMAFAEITPILDKRLSPYMLANSGRFSQLFVRLKKAVRAGIVAISNHMKKCEFEPLGYELSFSDEGDFAPLSFTLPGGRKVKLTGRIDRIDTLNVPENDGVFLRIIDYKSGSKEFDLADVYAGLNLQLAVYISALRTEENKKILGKNVLPAGMLYFRLIDPIVEASPYVMDDEIQKSRQKNFKLHGLVLRDEEILRAMDKDFGKSSDIIPARIQKEEITGSVATNRQFEILEKHIQSTVKKILTELDEGNIRISPYKTEERSACEYCNFKTICRHEGENYRRLEKVEKEVIWEKMEAEICK